MKITIEIETQEFNYGEVKAKDFEQHLKASLPFHTDSIKVKLSAN